MAEVLASLKKIGGNGEQYTETVLWTNPDPTSNFTGQNVTLSDSISNYKYIKFTWKTTTTDTTSSSAYVLSSDLASMTNSNGSRFLSLSSLWTNVYSRNITYNSATSISIATSTRQGASGNNNGVNIPLEIIGVNELAHQTVGERYDILPAVTVNAGAKPTFTTKGRAKALFLTYITVNGTVAYTVTNVNPYTGEYDNADTYRTATNSSEITHIGGGNPFIVTDNTITTTSAFSSKNQLKCIMAYTY